MAFFDPLTQLYNRRFFLTKLSDTIAYAKRNNQIFCIAYLDIDNFKVINDTKGHHIGDEILKEVQTY